MPGQFDKRKTKENVRNRDYLSHSKIDFEPEAGASSSSGGGVSAGTRSGARSNTLSNFLPPVTDVGASWQTPKNSNVKTKQGGDRKKANEAHNGNLKKSVELAQQAGPASSYAAAASPPPPTAGNLAPAPPRPAAAPAIVNNPATVNMINEISKADIIKKVTDLSKNTRVLQETLMQLMLAVQVLFTTAGGAAGLGGAGAGLLAKGGGLAAAAYEDAGPARCATSTDFSKFPLWASFAFFLPPTCLVLILGAFGVCQLAPNISYCR